MTGYIIFVALLAAPLAVGIWQVRKIAQDRDNPEYWERMFEWRIHRSPFPPPPDLTPGAVDYLTQREDGSWESSQEPPVSETL